MKDKEGRDWLSLSRTVFGYDDEDHHFKISDAGSTLKFSASDWKRIKKFVETKLNNKRYD